MEIRAPRVRAGVPTLKVRSFGRCRFTGAECSAPGHVLAIAAATGEIPQSVKHLPADKVRKFAQNVDPHLCHLAHLTVRNDLNRNFADDTALNV